MCLRNNNNNKLFTPEQLLNQFEDSSIPQSALNQPNNWSVAFSSHLHRSPVCVNLYSVKPGFKRLKVVYASQRSTLGSKEESTSLPLQLLLLRNKGMVDEEEVVEKTQVDEQKVERVFRRCSQFG